MASNPYDDMARNMGFSGWNADNIGQYGQIMGQANQLQQQGGFEAAGFRDHLQGQFNDFVQPQASAYRSAMMAAGRPADATDASLYQNADFQNYIRNGQLPQMQAQAPVTPQTPGAPMTPGGEQNQNRNTGLWQMLMQRAQQGLNVDRNDPALRAQADAYSANEQRASRNFLGDIAERQGPGANLRGEQRMAAERLGQRTGAFEADLVGREITGRRNEIAQALESMRGMLSQDQQLALQRELGLLDASMRERGLGLEQQRMGQQQDQFLRDLGLRDWDRQMYWDMLQRGVIG